MLPINKILSASLVVLPAWSAGAAADTQSAQGYAIERATCLQRELDARLGAGSRPNPAGTMTETEEIAWIKRFWPAYVRANGACGIPDENMFKPASIFPCGAHDPNILPPAIRSACVCREQELKSRVSAADMDRTTLRDMTDQDMGDYIVRVLQATHDAARACEKK